MSSPTDSELRKFARPDSLAQCDYVEEALRLALEMGSVREASAFVERKVVIALRNGWRPSLYRYCGVLLAFRKAQRPISS